MKLSVEISKYPLSEADFVTAIKDFIERLNQYEGIKVTTNVMSTQVFGDYDQVMTILTQELKISFEQFGTSVFVCKFVPGDLSTDKIER